MTEKLNTNIESQNSKEILPPGFQVIAEGNFTLSNYDGKKYSWIKFSYNDIPIDIPFIKNGNEQDRLLKLADYIQSTQEVYQKCQSDMMSLLKSCEPYVERGESGIHIFMNDHIGNGDTAVFLSQNIRDIIGVGNPGDEESNAVIGKFQELNLIPYDMDSTKEENSFAQVLVPFVTKVSKQPFVGMPHSILSNNNQIAKKI